eukprot:TRINITY_DN9851_c0_g2_i3.p3 TRINITY_DN9851_c0_g2~~TRINITY_DN9851_c0_g2_i3.p3  ORF type:complete len:102 (+),score=1.88 TRINITY_DN9851_c0_g2_i3:1365-1670(+)
MLPLRSVQCQLGPVPVRQHQPGSHAGRASQLRETMLPVVCMHAGMWWLSRWVAPITGICDAFHCPFSTIFGLCPQSMTRARLPCLCLPLPRAMGACLQFIR